MKHTKRAVVSVILAAVLLLSVGSCSPEQWTDHLKRTVSQSDEPDKPESFDVIIQALDNRDAEQFKSVFSKRTLSLVDDMDKGIAYIFGIYEGEYTQTVYRNYSSDKHYGEKNTALVNPIYIIETTAGKYYRIRYSIWTVQEEDPDSLGIYSLDISECDKDQRGAGGGSWVAGITYPEREGVELVVAEIAATMIHGDEKYLRGVLSDELLAAEGIEQRAAEYAREYSRINPSTVGDCWMRVREDGTFGYMVANTRPRTFIVFRMSQEQPDRMSGMKVTMVDEKDDLPEIGVEPDRIGLFFSKRTQ